MTYQNDDLQEDIPSDIPPEGWKKKPFERTTMLSGTVLILACFFCALSISEGPRNLIQNWRDYIPLFISFLVFAFIIYTITQWRYRKIDQITRRSLKFEHKT